MEALSNNQVGQLIVKCFFKEASAEEKALLNQWSRGNKSRKKLIKETLKIGNNILISEALIDAKMDDTTMPNKIPTTKLNRKLKKGLEKMNNRLSELTIDKRLQ